MALTLAAAKGYCSADDIAAFLGVTFTGAQLAQAEATIPRVERYIDNEVNRPWLTGPVLGETVISDAGSYPSYGRWAPVGWWTESPTGLAAYQLWMLQSPVQSVEVIRAMPAFGQAEQVLVEDTDYQIGDLSIGLIILARRWYRVRIDYTPVQEVPPDITQAATEIAATWLQPTLAPGTWNLDRYSLPDLTVQFNRGYTEMKVPATAQAILDAYHQWVIA